MKKINVITLGCSKNTVDSEHLMAQLAAVGYELEHDSDRGDADVVVINTCGFIGDAKEESVQAVLEAVERKKSGNVGKVIVFGCLSQRYASELPDLIPEVDAWFGAREFDPVIKALGVEPKEEARESRYLTTPSHYAYLKISEGCEQ